MRERCQVLVDFLDQEYGKKADEKSSNVSLEIVIAVLYLDLFEIDLKICNGLDNIISNKK